MSQHRQATDPGPSRLAVAATFLAATAGIAGTFWILAAPGDDPRHLTGGVFGFFLSLLLVGQWSRLQGEREAARRRVQRQERAAERRAAEVIGTTGMWTGDHPGQVLSVRYDRATGAYFAQGWLGDHWQLGPETRWYNVRLLTEVLTELETTGELRPVADDGTRVIRAWLRLPPIAPFGEQDPAATQPIEPVTEVMVLEDVATTVRIETS